MLLNIKKRISAHIDDRLEFVVTGKDDYSGSNESEAIDLVNIGIERWEPRETSGAFQLDAS